MVRRNFDDVKYGFLKNWFNIRYKLYVLLKIIVLYDFVNNNIVIVWGFLEFVID